MWTAATLRRGVYFTVALPTMFQPALDEWFFIPLSSQPLQVYREKIKRLLGVTGSSASQCILVAVLYDGLQLGCLLCITVFFHLGWSRQISGCRLWSFQPYNRTACHSSSSFNPRTFLSMNVMCSNDLVWVRPRCHCVIFGFSPPPRKG